MSFLLRTLPTSHNVLQGSMLLAAHDSLLAMQDVSGDSLKAAVRNMINWQAEALRVDRLF